MTNEAEVHVSNPAGFATRLALRIVGVGVICLSNRPIKNMFVYFGSLWNLGAWTIAERPIAKSRLT